ncbi:MAG: serine hydrolase [Planctomycetaceae bacterium]|nr:serine hydrolase [Planctomycetaceae bacterium]
MYVRAQQLFAILFVVAEIVPPISVENTVQASTQEAIGKNSEKVAQDKPQALHHICEAMAQSGFFSGTVLVAENSHVIYREAFGLANREWKIPNSVDTKFRLASVSKQFCSMIIMQLIQEEKLALNDPITKHLLYYRKDQGEKITLHHLLAHQSGIPDFTNSFDYRNTTARLLFEKDDFIKRFCSNDLTHEPGNLYSYSNAGYVILGRIIEKVTKRSYEQNVLDRITQPLGMTNTGYDRPQKILDKRASGYTHGPFRIENSTYIEMDPAPGAAGAIYSTVDDLFLWNRALSTDTLLKKFYRELMFTPNRSVPESRAAGGRQHSNYGYGWRIDNVVHPTTGRNIRTMSHGGAINGFRAIVSRIPHQNAYVALLCNQSDLPGSNSVWQTLNRMNTEMVRVVTEQPYKIPTKPKPSQAKKLYDLVCNKGVDVAISWFHKNGKKNPWGGSFDSVARELIRSEKKEEATLLYEYDIHQAPNKIWLQRKLVELYIQMGKFKKADAVLEQALIIRPDDERLIELQNEIRHGALQQGLGP